MQKSLSIFLTAIDVVIAVLGVSPKLLILSALSIAEYCRVLISYGCIAELHRVLNAPVPC